MNDDIVFLTDFVGKEFHTVSDGFLNACAAPHNPLKLVDIELLRVCFHHGFPAFNAYHLNRVNIRMPLEAFQCIDKHWLIEYINKLLRDVLPHPGSRSASYYDCNVLNRFHPITPLFC